MFIVSADFDDDVYHVYLLPQNLAGTSFSVTGLFKSGYMYDRNSNVENLILVSRP